MWLFMGLVGCVVSARSVAAPPTCASEVSEPTPASIVTRRMQLVCTNVVFAPLDGGLVATEVPTQSAMAGAGTRPILSLVSPTESLRRLPVLSADPRVSGCWEGRGGISAIGWSDPGSLPHDGLEIACGPLSGGPVACFRVVTGVPGGGDSRAGGQAPE